MWEDLSPIPSTGKEKREGNKERHRERGVSDFDTYDQAILRKIS